MGRTTLHFSASVANAFTNRKICFIISRVSITIIDFDYFSLANYIKNAVIVKKMMKLYQGIFDVLQSTFESSWSQNTICIYNMNVLNLHIITNKNLI